MALSQKNKPLKNKIKLEEGIIDYYKRVALTLAEGFSVEEEKDVFLNNVFGQFEEDPVPVCRCPQTSWIIEDLLEVATLSHIIRVLQALRSDWQNLCEDHSACHVLERLISVLPKLIIPTLSDSTTLTLVKNRELNDESVSDNVIILRLLLDLSMFTMETLDFSLTHVYASHVLRMLLQVLGGSCVGESLLKSRMSRRRTKEVSVEQGKQEHHYNFKDYPIPKIFLKKLKSFAKQIWKQENFGVILTDPNASPVIQTLLLVLHKNDIDLCQKYIHKVIKSSRIKDVEKIEDPDLIKLPPVALDSVGSFLVELVLTLASVDTYRELCEELFQGRLLQFAVHPKANFVLQRLISNCEEKEMFKKIFDEISQHLEDILASNHFGVAVALAERCQKLGTRQKKYRNLLMEAFHCMEPEERQVKFVSLLASFSTYEIFYKMGDTSQDNSREQNSAETPILTQINYHGSLILQHFLQFSNPKHVVTSLLDLKPVELKNMSCDSCGSHVIDTFFMAENIGEKDKDLLLNKLKGLYVEIACHRNGSRTLEAVWGVLTVKQKTLVATEICKQEVKVRSDKFGWHIHRNFALELFVKRKNDWIGTQGATVKKRELFKDFLDKSDNAVSVAKKSKHSMKPNEPGSISTDKEDSLGALRLQDDSESASEKTTLLQEDTVRQTKRQKLGEVGKDKKRKYSKQRSLKKKQKLKS